MIRTIQSCVQVKLAMPSNLCQKEIKMAWDSTMRIVEGKTDEEMAHIVYTRFVNGDTKSGTKYSLGGLYVHQFVTKVSKSACQRILRVDPQAVVQGKGVEYRRLQVRKMGITREHVIPLSALYGFFLKLYKCAELSEKHILDFMPKLKIALISNEENKQFARVHLTRNMPNGWWENGAVDPFERYRAAGLNDDIWVTDW